MSVLGSLKVSMFLQLVSQADSQKTDFSLMGDSQDSESGLLTAAVPALTACVGSGNSLDPDSISLLVCSATTKTCKGCCEKIRDVKSTRRDELCSLPEFPHTWPTLPNRQPLSFIV